MVCWVKSVSWLLTNTTSRPPPPDPPPLQTFLTPSKPMGEGKILKIKCHERPITSILFNPDGDLIFTSSKDSTAKVLRTDGSFLGTYKGHDGSIFSLALDSDSHHLYTGSADQSFIDWDVETGIALSRIETGSVVKACDAYDNRMLVAVSDDSMGMKREIFVYDNRTKGVDRVYSPEFNCTSCFASTSFIVLSDGDGSVFKFDRRNLSIVDSSKIHSERIAEIRPSACRTFFISSSCDAQAKIVDVEDFGIKRTFVSEEAINSSAIFSSNDKVICVGGVNAMDVTTTKGKSTVDTGIFDIITSERIGVYSTHYGTINAVDVHPLCGMYCSAGQEGIVHVVTFGDDFYAAPFTKIN